jgi:hypothetical protein
VLDLRNVSGEAARQKVSANSNQFPAPGDKMPDGTLFAGISPDSSKPMYTTPADASQTMTFNEAQKGRPSRRVRSPRLARRTEPAAQPPRRDRRIRRHRLRCRRLVLVSALPNTNGTRGEQRFSDGYRRSLICRSLTRPSGVCGDAAKRQRRLAASIFANSRNLANGRSFLPARCI